MARGLDIPVGVDARGGSRIVERDANDRKVIKTAMSDCDSDNAFQADIGLGSFPVFQNDTVEFRSQVLRRIQSIFADFERNHKYKLRRETIRWVESGDDSGNLELQFKYFSIESDEEFSFKETFTAGAGGV
jgi:hypothetical protein